MDISRVFIFLFIFSSVLWGEDKLKILQTKADDGNSQAAYELAEILYWAKGVERDFGQAGDYALVGALKGNPLAQYRYAVMQLLGHGVKQDVRAGFKMLAEAIPALGKLAEEGNPDALYKMGILHQLGLMKANRFNPNNEMALVNFRAAAELGHARAAFFSAEMVRIGLGTPKNSLKAFNLYEESASADFADAAFYIWIMHNVEGEKVVSQKDALRFLKQAAESGLKKAQREYGKALFEGKLGLKVDTKAALQWVRKAAMQGDSSSHYLIGVMYFVGSEFGIKRDFEESYFWFSIAARSSNKKIRGDARNRLNGLQKLMGKGRDQFTSKEELDFLKHVEKLKANQLDLLKRVGEYKAVETSVTANISLDLEGAPSRIQQSLRLDNLIMAADSSDPEAMFSLGDFYLRQKEIKMAESWLNKSAQKGSLEAMEALGDQYIHGGFGEPNFEEGSQWLKKAAAKGSLQSMNNLGGMALAGKLPGSKPADAVQWFRQAAEKGDAQAQTRLGELLYSGDVVKQDLKGGLKWIQMAASQNYPHAERALAIFYTEGRLEGPDYKEAAKWARRGAMQGDPKSQRYLGFLYHEGKGVMPSKLPKRIDHMRHAYRWLILAQRGGMQGLDSEMNVLQKNLEPADIKRAIAEADQFVANVRYNRGREVSDGQQGELESTITEANRGKAPAQMDLAHRFAHGDGVEIDPIKAYVWYTLALNQGNEKALLDRSKMIKNHGMGIDDIIAAKKQVRAFKPKP